MASYICPENPGFSNYLMAYIMPTKIWNNLKCIQLSQTQLSPAEFIENLKDSQITSPLMIIDKLKFIFKK